MVSEDGFGSSITGSVAAAAREEGSDLLCSRLYGCGERRTGQPIFFARRAIQWATEGLAQSYRTAV